VAKILIAVSPGLQSASYLQRKLEETLPQESANVIVTICEEGSALRQVLHSLRVQETWLNPLTLSRRKVVEVVKDVDHVILFWDGDSLTQLLFETRRLQKPLKLYAVEVAKVANRNRGEPYDIYIGRGTPWGNPYRVGNQEGEFTRDVSIDLFRKHFLTDILNDPDKRAGLISLRGYRLGCHCRPLRCHGDVIAGYLNSLDPEDVSSSREANELASAVVPSSATAVELLELKQDDVSPTHLFISYAIEDLTLATWLARKLAAQGYAVWFDQLKLLGGEPWPQSIDEAIKNRTFRMLALMSAASIHKQNPSKERTLGLAIGRQRELEDFLITLKVDDATLDWLTSDISYVPFQHGWAAGLRQLLKKLESISAPKFLPTTADTVIRSLSTGEELISQTEEELRANVIKVSDIPLALRGYRAGQMVVGDGASLLASKWPNYFIDNEYFIAFEDPQADVKTSIAPTREQWSWADVPAIHGIRTRNIVSNLILRTLSVRLQRAGCLTHPKQPNTFYLPSTFTADGLLRFIDYRGKRTWLKIRGTTAFLRPGKPREQNYHHFAFRLMLGRGIDNHFWIQITPSLFFFDSGDVPIVDKRVGPRRRRLTRNWWNNKWLNRLLATEQLLLSVEQNAVGELSLREGLLRLSSPIALNEQAIAGHTLSDLEEDDLPSDQVAIVDDDEEPIDATETQEI